MDRANGLVIAVVAAGVAFASSAVAQEKKLQRKDLPPAVEKTVAEQSQGATIKGFATEMEGGQKIYEMALTVNGHGRDISMDAQGHVLEIEDGVSLESLSPAVKDGLMKAAAGGTIGKVESLTKNGKLVAYEAVVTTGKKHHEVQVGPDGKKLAHPE
jgi:hypothetical protein